MATKDTAKTTIIAGLEETSDRKEAEYDLVKALFEAADYKNDENAITEVEIKRAGKYLFSVHIHPISDPDARFARKKATVYGKNPNGPKYAPIEKDFNNSKFSSWLIYLATTEEDQQKIWGNPQLMAQKGLMEPWESIDVLLNMGEKRELLDQVTKISGMDDDEDEENENLDEETYAKN